MSPEHRRSPNRLARVTSSPTLASILSVTLAVAFALAGCTTPLDDADDDSEPTGAGDGGTGDDTAVSLAFRTHDDLGEILVDDEGRTLYIFTNDDPGISNCYQMCAANWPPLLADEVPGAPDAIADELDLTPRNEGATQVSYRDLPLYHFVDDEAPGDATGDGLGGVWFVVRHPPANSEMLDDPGDHPVTTTEVEYHTGTTGFLATPDDVADAPGLVVIHEWWGLNDNIRDMTELLASHGYRALAVDLFDGNVATTSQEAMQQVGGLDQDEANANMQAAAQHLRDDGASSIVSLGWCFGGGQALQLALSGEALSGTVIYYGTPLVTDEERLDAIDWPVLGIFGEDDQAIPVGQVRAFESALQNVSVDNEVYIYPDVGHAFANPSGDAWAPEQTKDAWARTLTFLEAHGPT